MIRIISDHSSQIAELCGRYRVQRLQVFGSAARGDFDPSSSDIDLVADFRSTREPGYADRYLDFAQSLEKLLGHKVDLLTTASIRNRRFAEIIKREAVQIYDAEKPQAA